MPDWNDWNPEESAGNLGSVIRDLSQYVGAGNQTQVFNCCPTSLALCFYYGKLPILQLTPGSILMNIYKTL